MMTGSGSGVRKGLERAKLTSVDRAAVGEARTVIAALPFPEPAEDSAIFAWQVELLHLDSFYAGIASTVVNHDHPRVIMPLADELDHLRQEVEQLRGTTEHDALVLTAARANLAALGLLHDALLRRTP